MENRKCIVSSHVIPNILTAPLEDSLYYWTPATSAAPYIITSSRCGKEIPSASGQTRLPSPGPIDSSAEAASSTPAAPSSISPTVARPDPPSAPHPAKHSLRKTCQENRRSNSIELWHRRLAHLNPEAIRKLGLSVDWLGPEEFSIDALSTNSGFRSIRLFSENLPHSSGIIDIFNVSSNDIRTRVAGDESGLIIAKSPFLAGCLRSSRFSCSGILLGTVDDAPGATGFEKTSHVSGLNGVVHHIELFN